MMVQIESSVNKNCDVELGPFEPAGCATCDDCAEVSDNAICVEVTDFLDNGSEILLSTTSGYYTVITPSGVDITYASEAYAPINAIGAYCVYPSDGDGSPSGSVTSILIAQFISTGIESQSLAGFEQIIFDLEAFMAENPSAIMLNYTLEDAPDLLSFSSSSAPFAGTLDLSGAGPLLNNVVVNNDAVVTTPPLTSIILPSINAIAYLSFERCSLTEASVDAMANALDAGIAGGEVQEFTATSSAPSAASQVNRQALYDNGWTLPASWLTDLTL
jgi:hypothetical protein